jgi:hypothetical protein
MTNNKNYISLVIFVMIVLIVVIADLYIFNLPASVNHNLIFKNNSINQVENKTIEVLIDFTKLLITFALGILGFLGYLLKEKIDIANPIWEKIWIVVSGISAIFSIYFGHNIISSISEMLANGYFDFHASIIINSARLQYISLLFSITSIISFVIVKR